MKLAVWVVVAVLSVAVFVLAATVLGVLRQVVPLLEGRTGGSDEIELGAPVGSSAGPFTLYDEAGRPHVSSEALSPLCLVVMMSRNCEACAELIPKLSRLHGVVDGVPLLFVVDSPANELVGELSRVGGVLFDNDLAATTALRNRATPQAYLLGDGEVVLGRSIPGSARDLQRIVTSQRGGRHALATTT